MVFILVSYINSSKLFNYLFPVLLIVVGLLIAVGPGTIFGYCTKMAGLACSYSVGAERGIGAFVLLVGVLVLIIKDKGVRKGLYIGGVFLSLLALLTVTVLVGVCDGSMMACNKQLFPAEVVLGVVGLIISAVGFVLTGRDADTTE